VTEERLQEAIGQALGVYTPMLLSYLQTLQRSGMMR
jgi:hypothetical protein